MSVVFLVHELVSQLLNVKKTFLNLGKYEHDELLAMQ